MAHSYTNLTFHIVYGTRERRPLIDEEFRPRLYEYLGGTIRGLKGISLEIGSVEDHLHILVKLPPTVAVSALSQKTNANTSKCSKSVRSGCVSGRGGCGASPVPEAHVERVRRSLQKQREHHAGSSFRDELISLLE